MLICTFYVFERLLAEEKKRPYCLISLSCRVVSCRVVSCRVASYLDLPCRVMSYLTLSYKFASASVLNRLGILKKELVKVQGRSCLDCFQPILSVGGQTKEKVNISCSILGLGLTLTLPPKLKP